MEHRLSDRPTATQGDAICMDGVVFAWPGPSPFEFAIDRFEVARGERVLLLGPSGAGKSTLLALICGIVAAKSGTVEVLGEDLGRMGAPARDRFRAEHCGIIFQMFNLLPYATAIDNVLLPLRFAPMRRARAMNGGTLRSEAKRLLTIMGLGDVSLEKGLASSLSVGQQQRVAAGRALIGAPELIVADEPTSALDTRSQDAFLNLLFEEIDSVGATLVMVSHDERLVPQFDRVQDLSAFASSNRAQVP